jgi:hypothetical protein
MPNSFLTGRAVQNAPTLYWSERCAATLARVEREHRPLAGASLPVAGVRESARPMTDGCRCGIDGSRVSSRMLPNCLLELPDGWTWAVAVRARPAPPPSEPPPRRSLTGPDSGPVVPAFGDRRRRGLAAMTRPDQRPINTRRARRAQRGESSNMCCSLYFDAHASDGTCYNGIWKQSGVQQKL